MRYCGVFAMEEWDGGEISKFESELQSKLRWEYEENMVMHLVIMKFKVLKKF